MIVSIFSVTRKGTQSFTTPRQQLYNLTRLSSPSFVDEYTTQLLYQANANITPNQGLQVKANFETIADSMAGTSNPNSVVVRTPNTIGGVANTQPVAIRTGDLLYAEQNGSNVLWFVVNPNAVQNPLQYQFNSTTLNAEMIFWNNVVDNIDFTITYTSCTASSQTATYSVNQAVTLELETNTGEAWVPINLNTVSVAAGTGTAVFNFQNGSLVLNDPLRVIAIKADGTRVVIASALFSCTGSSASGSGTPTDCGEYAYFDAVWNNPDKTLSVGRTCTTGYNLQISDVSTFPDARILFDIETTSSDIQVPEITTGVKYARVRNLAGVTNWSAVYTFTVT